MDIKPAICMTKNGKSTKHTRHISRTMHYVGNVKECNLHRIVWCEGVLQPADIGTNNIREEQLNPGLVYIMVRLDNWHNNCQTWETGYKRVWGTMCFEWLDWI